MVKLKVLWIGKSKEPAIQALAADYLKRLSRYAQVEAVSVKDDQAVLRAARDPRSRHTLVLLDSGGKQQSSEQFSKFLRQHMDQAGPPLLFAVGGADGFDSEALKAADLRLSLGPMTFPHELALVLLLEQLFRAFTILKGHPYHLGH